MEIINMALTGLLVGLIMLSVLILLILLVGLVLGVLFQLQGDDWITITLIIMMTLVWIKIVYTWGPVLYVLLL